MTAFWGSGGHEGHGRVRLLHCVRNGGSRMCRLDEGLGLGFALEVGEELGVVVAAGHAIEQAFGGLGWVG
jgi:hypothetical protein